MDSARRTQGCWTCKKRKIGCDRGYPNCNNCLRTGRECLGYGIRLAWPDQPDGRRRKNRLPDQETHLAPNNSAVYGKQFLNVTYDDLARAKNEVGAGALTLIPPLPLPPPVTRFSLIPEVHERETHLIRYYQERLSRMISTIDINNGFRDDILPMALSSHSSASDGLRNAMLAVSAYHLWGSREALSYKHKALVSLGSSLSSESVDITETQLATSMMLCVFDAREGNWEVHLNGAKNILHKLATIRGGYLRYCFLYTWFLYHEVLGEFRDPLQYYPSGPESLRLRQTMMFDATKIIGPLGCSIEVMEIISYVNSLRAIEMQEGLMTLTPEEKACREDQWHAVETRVIHMKQTLDQTFAEQLPQRESQRIYATAELYRIATFLYLQRTRNVSQVHEGRSAYLEQAFQVLSSLNICTSPWPLFVIACESETDEQRIEILQVLDKMVTSRQIGNIFVLRSIIESFWKQDDLSADSGRSSNVKWWDVINLDVAAPWFI